MVHKLSSHKLLSLTVSLLFAFLIIYFFFTPIVSSREMKLNQDLARHFVQYKHLTLDATSVTAQVREFGRLSLVASDLRFDLELTPHDIRAADYRADEFGLDRVGRPIDPGPVRTFKGVARGTEQGVPLSQIGRARFTIDEQGIEGLIITPSEHYFVEPARKYSKAANVADYVMYKESDAVTSTSGECGVTLSETVAQNAAGIRAPSQQQVTAINDRRDDVLSASGSRERKIHSHHSRTTRNVAPAFPGCATVSLPLNNTVSGNLQGNCMTDGRWVDVYTFSGSAGEKISIAMSSSAFDPYIYLFAPNGVLLAEDNNGGGDLNARIPAESGAFSLPMDGTYIVYATSWLKNETGNYTILLASATIQKFTLVTAPAGVPLLTINDRMTINLTTLPATLMSIEVVPSPAIVGSVAISYDGQARTENIVPYSVSGDTNGAFNPADLSPGAHTLTARPFSDVDLGGTPGVPSTVNFSVVNHPLPTLAPIGCNQESSLKSIERTTPSSIEFVNGTTQVLNFYWLNFSGQRQFFKFLLPGESYVQSTFVTHPWVVTNSLDACANIFLPISEPARTVITSAPPPRPIPTPNPFHELRIATDADNEYVVSKGGSAAASQAILSILNQVEGIYEVELGLTLRVVYQSAWSTSNDPYSATNASALLGELADFWNANRGSVARDVVHMWTGKQLENATIGTAYLESLCRFTGGGRAAYGLSKGVAGAQQTAITAHELAHNLGATHPNQQVPPVTECNNTVMSSSVSPGSELTMCQFSRDEVAKYLAASAGCLTAGARQVRFAAVSTYFAGVGARSVATADFNGDGKGDVAVANRNGVSVLLGTDSGNFEPSFDYQVSSFSVSVAVGDFNGDSKLDLVTLNLFSRDVSVLLGTGDGTFQAAPNFAFGDLTPRSVAVGDFNNDARQDLVVVGDEGIDILLGTGTGSFEGVVRVPPAAPRAFPWAVAVGEFNGDGNQDLAVPDTTGGQLRVLLGTGTGSFQSPLTFQIGSSALAVEVGDFNGDGKHDIATGNRDSVSVLLGTGTGNFETAVDYPIAGINAQQEEIESIRVGDFNGDGKQDLATAYGRLSVLLGTGAGGFQVSPNYEVGFVAVSVAALDVDGDGKEDLVAAGDNNVGVLLGTGDGSFPRPGSFPVNGSPHSIAIGDFNNDTVQDLATANCSTNNISVLSGTGTGSFQSAINFGVGGCPQSVVVGDFNGDGTQDLATANTSSNDVSVLLGTGTGSFQPASSFAVGNSPISIVMGDLNGDGRQDLTTANTVSDDVSVLLGMGTGSFQPAINFASFDTASVAVGDFNSDDKQDLAIVNVFGNELSVLLGTGSGSFQSAINLAVSGSPRSVAVADFNGDGKQDLVTANSGTHDVSVLLGTGTGTFQSPNNFAVGNSPGSLAIGDFNGDGKQDLTVVCWEGVYVLLGMGSGTLQTPVAYLSGSSPNTTHLAGTVAVGDFNHDGKQDLVITNDRLAADGTVTVLLNTSGNFTQGPVNDNFASSRLISGSTGTLGGSTVLATVEQGEPNHAANSNGTGGASIWYRWKAPSTGRFYFQTFSSSFPTVLAVYTGASVNALTPVAVSTSSVAEYVEFDATAGATYQIAIDGVTGDTGRTVLNWNIGSLTNDKFAFAREIRGASGSVNGNNTNFTLEPNEPILPGPSATQFSAWYHWTAPNTGKVSFSTTPCGDTTRLLGAYTGNFIDTLTPVAVNFDGYRDFDDPGVCDNRSLRFNAVAGTTYRIQLRSTAGKPFTLAWSYANPPPNDNFANALILAGAGGSVVGTNRDATKEAGEPNHADRPGGASIWYRWTAPFSGPVTFDTLGFRNQTSNSFRYLTALLAVYTGSSLNGLTRVATNDTPDNKVTFSATAGITYQIAVDSAPYTGGGYLPGIVPLHWGAKQVANDDFANAQPLTASGTFVPLLGSNAGATKEAGEPNHQGSIGGASVWYRWTALSTGDVSFIFNPCLTCSLTTANTLVGVYTGVGVNALTVVPSTADSNHTFSAVRGTTYFIAVDSRTASGGSYEFSLVSANISARNDAFINAQVLSGNSGAVAGDNSGASREIAEPNHANDIGGASVWYEWKAPASGLYTFDTFGSNFDTLLAVYTGNVVSALTVVANSDNAGSSPQSRLTFDAKVDTTYFIAVDGKSNGVEQGTGLARSQSGFILLDWNNLPPPVNDNFLNAQTISGSSGNITGRNTVASKEGGEPNHAGSPGGVSVWYQWTAPSSGNFTFNTFGSDFNTLLGVYTGSALTALTPASNNDDVGGLRQSRVTFNAVAGTVYYIAVDGSVGVPGELTAFSGNVVLSWFPETGVSNNNFLSAQPLTGTAGSLAATNAGARKESGEPQHAGDRGGSSVWYTWTAPVTGPMLFTTAGSDFDTLLAIYTGNSINQLTPVASNDDSPYPDNLGHILTSSLSFNATAGTTYRIAVDGSGGRFGNFALRWGPDAQISGQVSFLGDACGFDQKVTMLLSGEDARAITFTGSGTYTFEHLRVGGNYSVRGVSAISASCLPLFLERAQNAFPLAGDVFDASFIDDGLRGGGSTSNITGHVQNAAGVALYNVAIALSGSASRTVYTDNAGLYLLPNLPAGTYQVTPSKAGVVFTPARLEFTFTSGRTITDADFKTQDSFNISGQTRDQNDAALSGVTITLNNGTQGVSVQTDGNGYYAFDATAGGSYTLTAAKAGLSFTPPAQSIPTLNANQKNFDFMVTPPPPQTRTLTVASANPGSDVNITVTPADKDNLANGATQFTRTYEPNSNVTLTAPATVGSNVFQKWLKDGADFTSNLSTSVTMDTNHTLTAVYVTPTRTLTIASANPNNGVNIAASPNDNNNQGGGSTQFTRTYNLNTTINLTAPATVGSNVFQKWQKDGADYSTTLNTSLTLDANHTLTAVYLTTAAQTPAGQNVSVELNGVKVTVASVTGPGTTTITPLSPAAAGQLPNGYQLTGDSIAFDITTSAAVQPPISVCFNVAFITDANVFAQLRLLHNENGVLVGRTATQDFANKLICASVNSLSPFVLASSSLPLLQLLLEESGADSTQAAALDAVLLLRDPFPVLSLNPLYPGSDRNTRVLVFVKNLQLQPGETAAVVAVNLVDSSGHSHDVAAEGVWTMPSLDFSQVTFRLPDGLSPGSCTLQIKAHNQVSNVGLIQIRP